VRVKVVRVKVVRVKVVRVKAENEPFAARVPAMRTGESRGTQRRAAEPSYLSEDAFGGARREGEPELSPARGGLAHRDLAVVSLDESAHDVQTEAGPTAA